MQADTLRNVSIFQDLTPGELEALKNLWTLQRVAPRERLIQEGAPMHHFHIVHSGMVHVRRLSQEHEVLLARIPPGGFFGEMNLFADATASASVYSMGESEIAAAPNATLRAFMASRPEIGYKIVSRLLQEVSHRLRQTDERLVHSLFWSPVAPLSAGE